MASMQMTTNDKGAAAAEQGEGRAEATTNPAPRPDGARGAAGAKVNKVKGAAVESCGVDDGNPGAPPAAEALVDGAVVEDRTLRAFGSGEESIIFLRALLPE